MKDKEFLKWLHQRLVLVHDENPMVDYLHKLRSIIEATPKDQHTPNVTMGNSIEEINERLQGYR